MTCKDGMKIFLVPGARDPQSRAQAKYEPFSTL